MTPSRNIEAQILNLKRGKNAVILAHNYQREEIQNIADFVGDSLDLSLKAMTAKADIIVFCGVSFMAETAKLLAPKKTVLLPCRDALCPMAEEITPEDIKHLRRTYPDAYVVCYINTTADVKAECDAVCTSANALDVIENIPAETIIFVPDKNLAHYIQQGSTKRIIPWEGCCYVHRRIRKEDIERSLALHPEAILMVHPECDPEVIERAHEVTGTGGMVRLAKESKMDTFLVGTEEGLIKRLKRENPHKTFYSAGIPKTCFNMKKIMLEDVYLSLLHERYKVEIPEEIATKARKALTRMLETCYAPQDTTVAL